MKPLETAFRHALSYLDQLDDARVGATATLDELRERFDVPLTADGVDGDRVIDDLVAATRGGLQASSSGRFFAWVIGGSHRASYLTHDAVARDAGDWTPEWSRRARSFPTYAALRFLGRNALADLIERCCRHAYDIVTRVGELPGAEVLAVPIINQGLLRFGDRTDDVIAAINATGEAFFSGTTWGGERAMRVSVVSWKTTDEDVDRVVNVVANVLRR